MPSRRISKPRFPCPNCGKQRESVRAACAECRYPNHERRQTPAPIDRFARRPFQFHLKALFIATTIACIFFAIYTRLGQSRFIEGLNFAGQLALVLYPIVWFYYRSIKNILQDDVIFPAKSNHPEIDNDHESPTNQDL
jgi:hypothetical protein